MLAEHGTCCILLPQNNAVLCVMRSFLQEFLLNAAQPLDFSQLGMHGTAAGLPYSSQSKQHQNPQLDIAMLKITL